MALEETLLVVRCAFPLIAIDQGQRDQPDVGLGRADFVGATYCAEPEFRINSRYLDGLLDYADGVTQQFGSVQCDCGRERLPKPRPRCTLFDFPSCKTGQVALFVL